jgi:hypothetical protein
MQSWPGEEACYNTSAFFVTRILSKEACYSASPFFRDAHHKVEFDVAPLLRKERF